MAGENDIRDKLAKLEALFARGATAGERAALRLARMSEKHAAARRSL